MKKILILWFCITCIGCEQNNIEIKHLSGYWEISKAENEAGKSKEFPMNESIDYIVLEDSVGFRKKVKPQYSGKFKGSKDVEQFKLKVRNASFNLVYKTPYDSWEEEIIELSAEKLVVKNQNGITYTYQRYKGLMEFDEEK